MQVISDVSDIRIAAIQNRAAFNVAYQQAPEAVRFRGKTLYKDRAGSVEEQLAYLAAIALTEPQALGPVVNADTFGFDAGAFALDAADRSALDAAVKAQREAEATLRKLEAELRKLQLRKPQIEREIIRWVGKDADCKIWDGADVGLAILTIGIGTGIKKTVCEQEAKDALIKLKTEQAKNTDAQEDTTQAIAEAKRAVVEAANVVKAEQAAYDEALKRQRAEEEAARLEKLEKQAKEAQERADARSAEAAAQAKIDAANAQAQREARAAEEKANQEAWATYCAQNPDDVENCGGDPYAGQGFTDESGNQWENDYWLDAETAEDTYGSVDTAADVGAAQDEDSCPRYQSPWAFDRYYACDCAHRHDDDEDYYGCDACEAVYGLDGTAYGADTGQVVGGIIAGVLVAAPAIISAFSDNQSGQGGTKLGEPGEQGQSGSSGGSSTNVADTILRATGFQSTIDNHAKTAGAESAAKLTPIIWALGLGVLVLGVAFVVKK